MSRTIALGSAITLAVITAACTHNTPATQVMTKRVEVSKPVTMRMPKPIQVHGLCHRHASTSSAEDFVFIIAVNKEGAQKRFICSEGYPPGSRDVPHEYDSPFPGLVPGPSFSMPTYTKWIDPLHPTDPCFQNSGTGESGYTCW